MVYIKSVYNLTIVYILVVLDEVFRISESSKKTE